MGELATSSVGVMWMPAVRSEKVRPISSAASLAVCVHGVMSSRSDESGDGYPQRMMAPRSELPPEAGRYST